MTGKVKCTCGWSWNKSDSSKKDMYICHECGRDNSNNMKDGGWLDKAQTGKIVPPETETAKAKKVARKVASTSGVGLVLDQFPGAETAYDLYNIVDGYKQGDPMKIIPNVMGALLPGLSGKAFEAITDEYLPKTPENEKKKIKAVLKGKRASTDEIRKAQESVDWSTGFKKLYDDAGEIGTDIKNTIDDTVSPLMGLKNGGWLDNYNDSEVSLPEGFVGEGIFNGPKFDNPAWGGQFQMGGNLPGAVGNMYARTGSPSKGPRRNQTDVTDASAQNGKEMQYYQNGLDFTPKSISKNGGWLDNYDEAQNGKKFKLKDERELAYKTAESTNVKKKNFDLEQSKSDKSYINQLAAQQKENKRRKALTQDQREREDYNARNEERGSIQAPVKESKWDRTKAIVSNPLTAFGYAARNESLPTRFQHGERNTLDNAIDWINPLQGIAAASEIPGELGRGEYLNAGLSLLDAADLGIYAKGAMKASKPLLQKAGRALTTEEGLLSNAYKYNPWAFKPNPEAYYRGIGKSGFDQAIETGAIGGRPNSTFGEDVHMSSMLDVAKRYGKDFRNPFNKNFFVEGPGNKTSYIAEIPRTSLTNPNSPIPYNVGTEQYPTYFHEFKNPKSIPLDDVKLLKEHWLQGYKEVPKQEDGGIIKDDRGQWDHPGEITEIGSNEITMEGVPYDVLGVSDTGDTKLMKPGKNYKFKGKKVTEYPMAKNGVNQQDQKTLQQLDQLTNFTNYNKPQPGGWLEAYK